MTQKEAVIQALKDLGGRAKLSDIYKRAPRYAHFGTKTPQESIRNLLQTSDLTRQPKKGSGWWELISYQEEIDRLKKSAEQKDMEIARLRELLTMEEKFKDLAVMCMEASENKDKEDRKELRNSLRLVKTTLNLNVDSDLNEKIESFATDRTKTHVSAGGNNMGVIAGGNVGLNLSPQGESRLLDGLVDGLLAHPALLYAPDNGNNNDNNNNILSTNNSRINNGNNNRR